MKLELQATIAHISGLNLSDNMTGKHTTDWIGNPQLHCALLPTTLSTAFCVL